MCCIKKNRITKNSPWVRGDDYLIPRDVGKEQQFLDSLGIEEYTIDGVDLSYFLTQYRFVKSTGFAKLPALAASTTFFSLGYVPLGAMRNPKGQRLAEAATDLQGINMANIAVWYDSLDSFINSKCSCHQ